MAIIFIFIFHVLVLVHVLVFSSSDDFLPSYGKAKIKEPLIQIGYAQIYKTGCNASQGAGRADRCQGKAFLYHLWKLMRIMECSSWLVKKKIRERHGGTFKE